MFLKSCKYSIYSYIISTLAHESAISPRSHGSFYRRMVLETIFCSVPYFDNIINFGNGGERHEEVESIAFDDSC